MTDVCAVRPAVTHPEYPELADRGVHRIRGLEGAHVHVHMRLIKAQVVAHGHDRPVAERAPDSTFALGYYRLAWAHSWTQGRGLDESTLELAARHAARLPERIRRTLAALQTVARGDLEHGVGMLTEVIEQHPDDFEANLWLGDLLFHENPPRGRSCVEARVPLERASVLVRARSAEDATFVRGRFLSLPSLDPPPAIMRAAMADLRSPALPTRSARTWAEPFAAMVALRLGDAAPAPFMLPPAVAIYATYRPSGETAYSWIPHG